MVGDLPFAEIRPPENVLFVCQLNPVTTSEDLELIFSRFGRILSCEVIRDRRTGDSLQYAFIEFEDRKSCEQAYFKMDGVLIDDKRVRVDFSQSVSRLPESWQQSASFGRWAQRGRGGFGGIEGLEKRRQYRNEEAPARGREGRYGYIFDKEEARRRDVRRGTPRSRSRSPRPDRRSRSKSPRRDRRDHGGRGGGRREDYRDGGRRQRSWSRERRRSRSRSRERDHDRDYRRRR